MVFESLNKLRVVPDYTGTEGTVTQIFSGASPDDYHHLKTEIADSGGVLYSETDIASNLHSSFSLDGKGIYIRFSPFSKEIRISVDTSVPSFCRERTAADKGTVLWQFEVDHSLIDCGMCYIIKCSDGSFFIIDSAHFYSVNDNERIHSFLKERSPSGEKIHISGWFFSHAHNDHVCKFMDYVVNNMSDTVIDAVYYNYPSSSHRDYLSWYYADRVYIDKFIDLVHSMKDTKLIKVHSGMRFFVSNLEMEILCTHEDVWPGSLQNFNDSSTVLLIKTCGNKLLFPGDAGSLESEILERQYSDYLKCDILQASHHGHFGTSADFYRLCSSPVIMFPNTRIKLDEEMPRYEANRVAVEIAGESYVSSEGTVEFVLPYQPGSAKVYPDETHEDFDGIYNLWGYEYSDEFKAKSYNDFLDRQSK